MWLPRRSNLWQRAGLSLVGLAGPLIGLTLLGSQLDLGVVDTPLYVAGLTTVGYLSLWSFLAAAGWAAIAAQLASLTFGRYGPYAAGLEPPPAGLVRRSLRSVLRARRA
jgi:hypothetical protein